MGLCVKCKKFLPPQLMEDVEGGKLCLFCKSDKDELQLSNGRLAKKEDVIKEYDVFMKMVKEKNDILKKAMHGDVKDIPTKILED